MAKKFKLARLRIYPVKALEGMDVDAWDLDPFGLQYDRRWMIVDASGRCITRREHPSLAQVKAEIERDRLVLSARHLPSVELPLEPEPGPTDPAIIGDETIAVRDISDDASRWLSEWLRTSCRLVYFPDARARQVNPALGTRRAELAFQDELPLQLLTAASIEDANQHIGGLPVEAFRPNFVIEGPRPYDEDTWRAIRIAGVEIRIVKPWPRHALVPAADPTDGVGSVESLATYRELDGEAVLGQLAIHSVTTGTLRIGEVVEVLERGEAPVFGPGAEEEPEEAEPAERKGGRRQKSGEEGRRVRVISLPEGHRPREAHASDGDEELPWEVEEPEEAAEEAAAEAEPPAAETESVEAETPEVSEPGPAEPEPEEPEQAEPEPAEPGPGEPEPEPEPAAEPAPEPAAAGSDSDVEAGAAEAGIEVVTDRMPDAGQVVRLLAAAAVTESKAEAKRLARACLDAPVLVTAWSGDTLVGLLRGWTDEVRDGFIADVAVHPDHHGSGAAQELVQKAVAMHPDIRWVLRASPGSAYLGSALGWQHAGSGWYLSPR